MEGVLSLRIRVWARWRSTPGRWSSQGKGMRAHWRTSQTPVVGWGEQRVIWERKPESYWREGADPHGTRTHALCLCSRLILVCHPLLLHLPFHKFGLGSQLCPYSGFLTHKWKPHSYSCWLLQWCLSRMEKLLLLGIFTEPQSGSLSSCENFESCPCSLSRPCLHLGIDIS